MAHYEGKRYGCSCSDGTCDMNCRMYRIAAGKPSNADRIRGMTGEELDKFLGEVQWDVANYCGGVTQKQEYPVPEQSGAWLDWLEQEADDAQVECLRQQFQQQEDRDRQRL